MLKLYPTSKTKEAFLLITEEVKNQLKDLEGD
jgi:hypothetical protein